MWAGGEGKEESVFKAHLNAWVMQAAQGNSGGVHYHPPAGVKPCFNKT